MPVSRRGFLRITRPRPPQWGSGAFLAARGLEAHLAEAAARGALAPPLAPPAAGEIRISSNENPLGPGPAALEAILNKFPEAGRYPFNSTPADRDLAALLATQHGTKPDTIVLGAGSQEILKNAVRAFTSRERGLVTASPSFENCPNIARKLGHPVTEVKVDSALRLDLDPMVSASAGAGLVFFCNPNNPTATVHGAKAVTDFVERVRRASPDTVILIDEAYHDYVTDPAYQTAVPLALATPNVLVSRTFSKAYGMAGMRIGYGIGRADTMKRLAAFKMPYNVSVLGVAAATASLKDAAHIDRERARNTEALRFTVRALDEMGCKSTDSHTNFLFVDVGRPAREFREACARQGVMVGRDFPPFEKTHARISIGTLDEMRKATEVFRSVLRPTTTTSAREKE